MMLHCRLPAGKEKFAQERDYRVTRTLSRWVKIAFMDSMKLRPWQAKVMYRALHPGLGYLYRLRERMSKRFLPTDPLLILTDRAYQAVHALSVELHYLSCADGVWRERQR
jgi:hypothetical protein